MRTMSSDDSDSDFHEFVADLNQTLPTGLENDSDISVSSVETGKLSQVAMKSGMSVNQDRYLTVCRNRLGTLTKHQSPCDFEESVGSTLTLLTNKNELDFFELLFSATLYEWIATETNRYSSQCQLKSGKVDKLWAGKPTSAMDISCLLGIHIYMLIVQLPSYKMYWTSDHLFGNFPVKSFIFAVLPCQ